MAYTRDKDRFANTAPAEIIDPGVQAAAVTPNDATDLAVFAKALWVGVAGNVALVPLGAADDTGVIFAGCQAGSIIPMRCRRVLDTGTTATSIVAITA